MLYSSQPCIIFRLNESKMKISFSEIAKVFKFETKQHSLDIVKWKIKQNSLLELKQYLPLNFSPIFVGWISTESSKINFQFSRTWILILILWGSAWRTGINSCNSFRDWKLWKVSYSQRLCKRLRENEYTQ